MRSMLLASILLVGCPGQPPSPAHGVPAARPVPVAASAAPGEEIGVYLVGPGSTEEDHLRFPVTSFVPCRDRARKELPPQKGWVEVDLAIEHHGVVTKASLRDSDGLSTDVVQCVLDAAKQMKLPGLERSNASAYLWVSLR